MPSITDDHAFVSIDYDNESAPVLLSNVLSEFFEELVVVGDQGRLKATENKTFMIGIGSANLTRTTENAVENLDLTYPLVIEQSGHHGSTYFEHMVSIAGRQGRLVPRHGDGKRSATVAQQSVRQGKRFLWTALLPKMIWALLNLINNM